jgi:hypothetical protein
VNQHDDEYRPDGYRLFSKRYTAPDGSYILWPPSEAEWCDRTERFLVPESFAGHAADFDGPPSVPIKWRPIYEVPDFARDAYSAAGLSRSAGQYRMTNLDRVESCSFPEAVVCWSACPYRLLPALKKLRKDPVLPGPADDFEKAVMTAYDIGGLCMVRDLIAEQVDRSRRRLCLVPRTII